METPSSAGDLRKKIIRILKKTYPNTRLALNYSNLLAANSKISQNGKEIFYVSLDSKMMAAPVKLSPDGQSLETGTPAALFPVRIADGPLPGSNKQQYAVSSDGQRFLVNLATGESAASPITLILNWHPERGK